MKSFKILIAAAAMMTMLFSGCQKDVFTGIDSTKPCVKDLCYDDVNSSEKVVAVYFDNQEALKAGATSFSVQLAVNEDFRDVDMYDTKKGKTIAADASVNDGCTFSGLTEYARYYVRVRANYPRSIYSDWCVLEKDGSPACVSVGHGIISMEFAAPVEIALESEVYSKITASWDVVGPADGYAPEWKKSDSSEWIALNETTKVNCEITGTEPTTSYDVRVRAYRTVDGSKEYTEYVQGSITTPAKPAFVPQIETAEQLATFFNEIAATASATDAYTLQNDIDMAGTVIPVAVSAFAGSFDGQGHTVKNAEFSGSAFTSVSGSVKNVKLSGATLGNSFIGYLAAGATVSSVELDAACKVNFPAASEAANYGDVVGTNEGTIEGCKNASAYSQTFDALPASVNFGGIVGYTTGTVKNCENSGARAFSVSAPTTGTFHTFGGVVGQYAGTKDVVMVQNCSNSGAVSVEINTACYFFTGGVVGGTPSAKSTPGNYGIIEGCTNTGAVSMHYIAGGSGAYPNIGGVVGYTEGYLKSCENSGNISLVCDSEANTWTCPREAGVAGTCTCGAYDCKNHGGLTADALFAGGTAGNRGAGNIASGCFAGVIASAGPYTADGTVVFEKCVNDANISIAPKSITETPNSYYGAVIGYCTGKIVDCHNTGSMYVTCPIGVNRLGGVAGGTKYGIENSTNTGAMTVESPCKTSVAWRSFVGGIVGDLYTAGDVELKGCTNSGAVTFKGSTATTTSTKTSGVGGLVGCKKSGSTVTYTSCSNTGAVSSDSASPVVVDSTCGGDYN